MVESHRAVPRRHLQSSLHHMAAAQHRPTGQHPLYPPRCRIVCANPVRIHRLCRDGTLRPVRHPHQHGGAGCRLERFGFVGCGVAIAAEKRKRQCHHRRRHGRSGAEQFDLCRPQTGQRGRRGQPDCGGNRRCCADYRPRPFAKRQAAGGRIGAANPPRSQNPPQSVPPVGLV